MDIQIDESMLGSEWNGAWPDLEAFAEILEQKTGLTIAVSDSFNGAENTVYEIEETDWNDCLDEHARRYPDAWPE